MPDEDRQSPNQPTSLGWRETGPKPNDLLAPAHDGFRVDRGVLAESVDAEDEQDTDCGIQRFGETPGEQIQRAVQWAQGEQALHVPDGVKLVVLNLASGGNAVVLAIRETHETAAAKAALRASAGLPAGRQIATCHIEPASLSDHNDTTFGGLCVTLEEVCKRANGLLASLQALLDGEAMLLDLIAGPLTVITYNDRARLASFRANVTDLTEGDADNARDLWPLLIEALERGEADEDWDGARQRAFRLQPGGEPHLARQLVQLRNTLQEHGALAPGELPDPTGGFDSWTR